MSSAQITRHNVLDAVRDGADTIWALAVRFGVSASSRELHEAIDGLLERGLIAATSTRIYDAKLREV
jgi:hypothetical protein